MLDVLINIISERVRVGSNDDVSRSLHALFLLFEQGQERRTHEFASFRSRAKGKGLTKLLQGCHLTRVGGMGFLKS